MKKRLTALLLVISMMFGMLSVGAAGAGYAFTDDDGTGTWSWASEYIYDCYDAGIINGYEDGTYLPDNSLTRAEAAKIIAVTFGLESDTAASTFSDVADSHWALQYIEACVEAGIINGYEDGTFLPGNNVTRTEMAKMIAAALELTADAEESSFNDTASHWAMTYIEACVDAGIVNGYEDGTFLPGNSISRAEAATIISRTLDCIDAEKEADQLLKEFKAKDTEDFEDCEIINFDEDETTNFAVLAEDAAVVTSSGSENVLASADEDSGVYVIENASDEVIALQAGDVLYYVYGDETEDYLLIKIAELTLSDGAVTLVAETEDVDLSDFFCYIDVDMELEVTEDNFTPAESDSVTYLGAASEAEESAALLASASTSPLPSAYLLYAAETTVSDTFSFEISHEFPNGYKVMGTLKQKFSVNLMVEYDLELFGEDYSAFSLSLGSKSSVTAAFVSTGIDSDDDCELLLGGISIPVGGTPLLIEAQVYAALDLSLKTSVVLTAEFEAETGISYDSEDGFDLIGEADGEISLKSEVSGSVFVGPKLDISLDGLKVFDISVEGKAGLNVKGTSDVLGISTDGDVNHLCTLCIDGEVNLAASAKGTFKILDNPIAASDEIEASRKLCDFYVSLYDGDELEFGTGTCPHKEYRVTVTAQDSDGNSIAGASVYYDANLQDDVTDENGEIILWCEDGTYTVSILKDGYSVASMTFTVDGEAMDITVTLLKSTGTLEVTVTDADSNAISGAAVTISQGSSVLYELTTGSDGMVNVSLPTGTYIVTVETDGYESHSSTVEIEADLTTSESVQLKSTVDDLSLYTEILDMFYYGISSDWAGYSDDELMNISYMIWQSNPIETLSDGGYALIDLDGNGVSELIITAAADSWGNADGFVYDIYTYTDGEILQLVNSAERNRYYLCSDNLILNESSGGASYSEYTLYQVIETSLSMVESLVYDGFTDADNPWFYTYASGSTTQISGSNASTILNRLESLKSDFDITLFSEYTPTSRTQVEVTDYLVNYTDLISVLDMAESSDWYNCGPYTYEADGFYLNYDPDYSLYAMYNTGNTSVTLYGCTIGDDAAALQATMDAAGWADGEHGLPVCYIDDQLYLIEYGTDSSGKITYWYLANWDG